MSFAKFMASVWGRLLRIAAGLVLVYLGYFVIKGTGGDILAVVGLAPIISGVFNFCIFAPIFGGPFNGRKVEK